MKTLISRLALLGGLWVVFELSLSAQSYTFTTIAGLAGVSGTNDGVNSSARFFQSSGLALDTAGNLYVADLLNHTIRKISPDGTNWVVTTLAGLGGSLGSADGTNDQARFNRPSAVAVDNAGNVFVTDNYNQTIRKLTSVGTNWVVSTVAGLAGVTGFDDGTNSQARFHSPRAIAVDSSDRLYVTDGLNFTVREVEPVGTNWVASTLAGLASIYGGFVDGINGDAEFNLPFGISRHAGGNLYVSDFGNNAIRRIVPQGPDWVTSTVTGFSGNQGSNDGPAMTAMLNGPNGITVDASETLYVADQFNSTIRKIEPVGGSWVVSTVGGLAGARGTNDGVGAISRFYRPGGIAVDQAGNLFVADTYNYTIRRGMLVSAPTPALQIVLAADQIVLSWPIAASNYVLETSSALGSGAAWTTLTNGVVVSDSNYSVTNNVNPGQAFFRLRSQ